jgi:hypothetical protein
MRCQLQKTNCNHQANQGRQVNERPQIGIRSHRLRHNPSQAFDDDQQQKGQQRLPPNAKPGV